MTEVVYSYCDEQGVTLFEVVRVDEPGKPKKIWQRTPDGGTSLDGVRRVLYRLPQLMAAVAAKETVWLVEGERCVGALARLGLVATTSAGGAGGWRPALAAPLAGATVVILPDNDEPGVKYGVEVAVSLSRLGCEVRIVDLPGLPHHGDIVDWLQNGGSKEELLTLAAEAPYWLPPPDDDDDATIAPIVWGTFWSTDHSMEEWMVEPLIPLKRGTVIYSEAKTGKSLLALDMALAVATGDRCLESPPQPRRDVVYLDMEMTEDDLKERLLDMGVDETTDLSRLHYYSLPSLPPLDTPEGGLVLQGLAAEHDAVLVVIDTTTTTLEGDENSADTMRAYWNHTGKLLKRDGRTVLRLDHQGKDPARGQRGSSQKIGTDDVVWQMVKQETDTGDAVKLVATHRRINWCPERVELVRLEQPTRHEIAHQTWPSGTTQAAALLDSLNVDIGASKRQAREALKLAGEKMRDSTLREAIRYRRDRASASTRVDDEEPGILDSALDSAESARAELALKLSGLID